MKLNSAAIQGWQGQQIDGSPVPIIREGPHAGNCPTDDMIRLRAWQRSQSPDNGPDDPENPEKPLGVTGA